MPAKKSQMIRAVKASERMAILLRIMLSHPGLHTVRQLCGFIEDVTGKEPVFSTVWRDICEMERHGLARRRTAITAHEGTRIELLIAMKDTP